MSDNVATHRRRRVADPLREFADRHADKLGAAIVGDSATAENSAWHYLYKLADQIDREHERRMEQCRHETKRAFAKYLRQITAEYERSHKRKSWLAQQRMQLELDVLRYKEARDENH